MHWYYPLMYNSGYPNTQPTPVAVPPMDCGCVSRKSQIQGKGERPAPPLPYGPYTCKQGYVWREATPNDFVCVEPQVRDEVARENALGPSRVQPGGGPYGPDTCRQGFVWRETRPTDHVCVPPQSRERARRENALAARTLAYPPATPNNGISVWETISNRELRLNVRGTFSPNNQVSFYVWDETVYPPPILTPEPLQYITTLKTDANGQLISTDGILQEPGQDPGVTTFAKYSCTNLNNPVRRYIIVLDEGSGTVSNAGMPITWCGN
ncbi:hypothetical protein [Desertibacillus haloalkaliphilus]|uniref:hypothetical protein n=1 Tax=Desertibacillus haloalkaliphilus TaxID=1328930 RepID=UPI001C270F23|nr:hypothetical protein [Desertibacillus haloalkaliphilus]MBU8907501.1 hypothetical protein [Desertibacillus haloalkaliphilus]